MQLLITYDDQAEAEAAEKLIEGDKRLASDRDDNEIIYRLFGQATWSNFYKLGMYDLPELEGILAKKKAGLEYDKDRHETIVAALSFVAKSHGLTIPSHWV